MGKEFKVEVEVNGHVRHKNLLRLLGYSTEGAHRFKNNDWAVLSEHVTQLFLLGAKNMHSLYLGLSAIETYRNLWPRLENFVFG
ncbi:probable receptor-like protein kinase At2g42960 isoform X1 [Malus domestica]|uniref:probable receptor-like protein kinase At2g42960 isoform X1 n=1 Tax=Malus domestica TaxID=3750 RepID=UPI003976B322